MSMIRGKRMDSECALQEMKSEDRCSKIALFGLTADPFHWGHAACIEACKTAFPFHNIVVMPCKTNPLGKYDADGKILVPTLGEFRYEMLARYFQQDERVLVSRYEIDNLNPSYTIDTIRYLKHAVVNAADHRDTNHKTEVTVFMGTDNFLQLPYWHQWQDIFEEACVVVMVRAGYSPLERHQIQHKQLKEYYAEKVRLWQVPQLCISSTVIRRLIREGADDDVLSHFLPSVVLRYIRANINHLSSAYRK